MVADFRSLESTTWRWCPDFPRLDALTSWLLQIDAFRVAHGGVGVHSAVCVRGTAGGELSAGRRFVRNHAHAVVSGNFFTIVTARQVVGGPRLLVYFVQNATLPSLRVVDITQACSRRSRSLTTTVAQT